MDQQLICELNLALIPETELASRHITFSRQMAGRYRSLIQLNGVMPKVAFTPHVPLYQVPVQARDLPARLDHANHLLERDFGGLQPRQHAGRNQDIETAVGVGQMVNVAPCASDPGLQPCAGHGLALARHRAG